MLFIGHTRFSIFEPGSTAWLASNGSQFSSPKEYENYLYSEERLKLRADIFIGFSLPQLELAAANHNIRHIVAYSDNLPLEYQNILEAAAARFPFIVLDRGTSEHRASMPGTRRWEELIKLLSVGETLIGVYRLDDDDLLPVDYFDQMTAHIRENNVGMQISLASGMTAFYENSQFHNLRRYYSPMCSAGLMNVCKIDDNGALQQPKRAPHHLADRSNPVILDSRKTGFLRLRHVTQDGALRSGEIDASSQREKMMYSLNKAPAVQSTEEIEKTFPALKGHLVASRDPARELRIPNGGILSKAQMKLSLTSVSNTFRFVTLLKCSEKTSARNALMSFDLKATDGSAIDTPDRRKFLLDQNISYSKNKDIGFYRYLRTAPGKIRTVQQLVLPEGVVCRGVSIQKWKDYAVNVRVLSVTVADAPTPDNVQL
jgi:hypothetical protein